MDMREAQTELRKFVKAFKTVEHVADALQAATQMESYMDNVKSRKVQITEELSNLQVEKSKLKEEYEKESRAYTAQLSNKKSIYNNLETEYQEKSELARTNYLTLEKEWEEKLKNLKIQYSKIKSELSDEQEIIKDAVIKARGELEALRSRLSNVA